MERWVAGADGCPGGWFVVLRSLDRGELRLRLAPRVADVLRWSETPEVLAIDIPIGLLDAAVPGGRPCDVVARARLGPRKASLFTPPVREALVAATFEEALRINRQSSPHRLGISQQCFAIAPKIREVDDLILTGDGSRLVEVHPELCFAELAGAPMRHAKRRAAGRRERIALLEAAWQQPLAGLVDGARSEHGDRVARDDVVDAMVACWTAARVARGEAVSYPAPPVHDERGVPMVMRA